MIKVIQEHEFILNNMKDVIIEHLLDRLQTLDDKVNQLEKTVDGLEEDCYRTKRGDRD